MSGPSQITATDQPITRRDVEEIVTRVVSEAMGEALKVISAQFVMVMDDLAEIKFEIAELKTRVSNLERKLDATISHLDRLSVKVNKHDKILQSWQPKPA